MEQKNEPTTGEIVRALRELVYEAERKHETQLLCTNDLVLAWAHDLERKESDVAALTARAESAERERDALLVFVPRICTNCISLDNREEDELEKCRECMKMENRPNFKWRGLQPQDGEGK